MRAPVGHQLLRLLGGLCSAVGVLAWIRLAWAALSDPDGVTPQSDAGGRLMLWALTGTVLMIAGVLLLHFAPDGPEDEQRGDRSPPG
jgi:hypothetical protein